MAFFSYLFMNRFLEKSFSQIPESIIQETLQMQNQAVKNQNKKTNETARMLAAVLDGREITDQNLSEIIERGSLTHLEILSTNNETLAQNSKNIAPEQQSELENTLDLVQTKQTRRFASLSDGRNFDAAIAKFADGRKLVLSSQFASRNKRQRIDRKITR